MTRESNMIRLVSHLNVHETCIAILEREGWTVSIEPGPYEECDSLLESYRAEKDGVELLADSPVELLGLAAIHGYHAPHGDEPYWWKVAPLEPGLLDRLQTECFERGLADLRERDQSKWREIVCDALSKARDDPQTTAADRLGVSEAYLADVLLKEDALVESAEDGRSAKGTSSESTNYSGRLVQRISSATLMRGTQVGAFDPGRRQAARDLIRTEGPEDLKELIKLVQIDESSLREQVSLMTPGVIQLNFLAGHDLLASVVLLLPNRLRWIGLPYDVRLVDPEGLASWLARHGWDAVSGAQGERE